MKGLDTPVLRAAQAARRHEARSRVLETARFLTAAYQLLLQLDGVGVERGDDDIVWPEIVIHLHANGPYGQELWKFYTDECRCDLATCRQRLEALVKKARAT